MLESLKIIPLGGLGEIGMNCMVLETSTSMLVIDCGIMFPQSFMYGIDVVIPCLDYIIARKEKLKGIVITHGHEDHIGALPWLLKKVNAPIYSSEFTLRLITKKLDERLISHDGIIAVRAMERLKIAEFAITFLPVSHSIIQGFALGIETPVGKIIHTGDFKIEKEPVSRHHTDLRQFKEFAKNDTLLLFSDSTNVERIGWSVGEHEVTQKFRNIFDKSTGRILFTLFSTHMQRIQEIFDLTVEHDKKIVIAGKSLEENIEIARNLGFLKISDEFICPIERMYELSPNQVVVLLTGSQGEPFAVLSRVARGEHKQISIQENDVVVMSSRFIPGNTQAITSVINSLYRLGARVVYETIEAIHASGHAYQDELSAMLRAVNPSYFVPIHGEYRHLRQHADLAYENGIDKNKILIIEDGQSLILQNNAVMKDSKISLLSILVDGKGVGDINSEILKERGILADSGVVGVLVNLNRENKKHQVRLVSKGFVLESHYPELLELIKLQIEDILKNIASTLSNEELELKIRSSLRKLFRDFLDRDPIILPFVIDNF